MRSDRLSIAVGPGLVVRRGSTLLFLPHGAASPVREAFEACGQGDDLVEVLGATVVEHDFAMEPFLLVDWSIRPELMVFGDVLLETDQPSLPMLTGVASGTWVEHAIRAADAPVTVRVNASDIVPESNLVDGTVPASGFELVLRGGTEKQPDRPVVAEDMPAGGPAGPHRPDVVRTAAQGGSPLTEAGPVADLPKASPSEPLADPAETDAMITLDGTEAADLVRSLRDSSESGPALAEGVPEPSIAIGEPAPEGSAPDDDPAGEVQPAPAARVSDGPMVEAVQCADGHFSPPASSHCRSCNRPITSQDVSVITRPVMARLVFDDGTQVDLEEDLIIGRGPAARPGVSPCLKDGPKISRSHLEVRISGWDVFVVDLNSKNGTHMDPGGDGEPFRIEPGVLQRLEQGATVYMGSVSFSMSDLEVVDG